MNFLTGLSNWSETSNRFDVGGNQTDRVSIEKRKKEKLFLPLIFHKLSDFIISMSLFIRRQLMVVGN